MAEYFLGVDVGTGSVRAAVASADGRLLSRATRPLQLRRPRDLYYEQSSSDVWAMVRVHGTLVVAAPCLDSLGPSASLSNSPFMRLVAPGVPVRAPGCQ